jgi:hypothetical protein
LPKNSPIKRRFAQYQATLLDGEPAEVVTQIGVNFTLARRVLVGLPRTGGAPGVSWERRVKGHFGPLDCRTVLDDNILYRLVKVALGKLRLDQAVGFP